MSNSGRLDNSLEKICRRRFTENGCHGWEHVERVRALCRVIGEREGADLRILDAAALLHDSGRASDERDHARKSAEFTLEVLTPMGLEPAFIQRVAEAVMAHSFSSGRAATSIEAKVLSDADRLDAMGAIGIYRTVQYNTEHGYSAEKVGEHIREKLLKLEDLLYTETAREMARPRTEVLRRYLEALELEIRESSTR